MNGIQHQGEIDENLVIHDDMIGAVITKTVSEANEGDDEAARRILKDFVGAIKQFTARTWHGPVHWEFAQYIAKAFEKILDGADPARSLGMKKKGSGRRKGRGTFNQSELGAAYWLLILKGYKSEQAISKLRDDWGPDRRTVQRASKWAKDRLYNMPRLYSESLLHDAAGKYATRIK